MDERREEHYERELQINLKFIFNRVSEDIVDLKLAECDNKTILEKLCVAGLMSEEERQSVICCVTHSDKNK